MTGIARPAPWRAALWSAIAALLLAPLLAMRFTREVNWGAEDFAFAAVLLIGAGVAFEIAVRVLRRRAHVALAGAAVLAIVLIVWAQAAVGIV